MLAMVNVIHKNINYFVVYIRVAARTGTRCYRKVSGLGQKGNAGLTYSILAAISSK
jgi:hypothetical protein